MLYRRPRNLASTKSAHNALASQSKNVRWPQRDHVGARACTAWELLHFQNLLVRAHRECHFFILARAGAFCSWQRLPMTWDVVRNSTRLSVRPQGGVRGRGTLASPFQVKGKLLSHFLAVLHSVLASGASRRSCSRALGECACDLGTDIATVGFRHRVELGSSG